LAADLPKGIALVHELVTRSDFPESEFRIQRTLTAKALLAQEDEIFDVGTRLLRRILFEPHPYQFHPLGSRETIDTLTRQDCVDFARAWITPANAVVSVFGSLDPAAVKQQLDQTFGRMPGKPSAWPKELPEPPTRSMRRASKQMEREQTVILWGFRGNTYLAKDRYAADVMTSILSGMSGRLFQSVREKYGLSYTLGAVNSPGWDPGYVMLYAATRPDEEAKVQQVLEEQMALVVDQGFTPEEVDQAKNYLIGNHRLEIQHLVGLAKRVALDDLYGVGFDSWRQYEQRIQAIDVQAVNAAAKKYLTLPTRSEVVVSPDGQVTP
jgi:zinc protease